MDSFKEWLTDKKNQPIVIAGAAAVVIIVLALVMLVSKNTSVAPTPVATSGGSRSVMPSGTNGTSAGSSVPGMAAPSTPSASGIGAGVRQPNTQGASAGRVPGVPGGGMQGTRVGAGADESAVASTEPMFGWRPDPFLPLSSKMPKGGFRVRMPVIVKPRIADLPVLALSGVSVREQKVENLEPQQPARRMAGILLNSRIFAILETNGRFQIVQPGDDLDDMLATVDRVEKDRVILRTKPQDPKHKPRYITVRMAASPTNSGTGTSGGMGVRGAGTLGGPTPMLPRGGSSGTPPGYPSADRGAM